MQMVAISELKASLSRFLALVKAGDEVVVTERGHPVARLIPVTRTTEGVPDHVLELQRKGLVRVGTTELPQGFWELPRPADEASTVLNALLDEREKGR